MSQIEKAIVELQEGVTSGLDYLYSKFKNLLFKISLDYSLSKEDAEELMNDTFIKMIKAIDKFHYKGEKQFLNWLITIHVNHIREFYRKQKRKPDLLKSESMLDALFLSAQNSDNLNIESDKLIDSENENIKLRIVKDEIATLPEEDRILLTLRAKGIPYKTISEMIGKSPNALKVYYLRLHRKLVEKLSALFKEMKIL